MSGDPGTRMRALIDREIANRAGARVLALADGVAKEVPRAAIESAGTDQLESDVLAIAAAALRMVPEKLDLDENLATYGVDSIAITEVMASISRVFRVSIAPTTFFEAKNLKDLANILRARYGVAVAAHYASRETAKTPPVPRSDPQHVALSRRPGMDARVSAPAVPAQASGHHAESQRFTPDKAAAPVAIIGMEGMFPQSPDLETFARHLAQGRDLIEEVPPARWDWRAIDGDPRQGPYSNVKYGGFVPGHDLFDAAFFKIPPSDAEFIDPQHRLFMECVWKLIEGAGYAPGSLAGRKVGMFLGINLQDYAGLANRNGTMSPAQLTGLGHIFCPNRLSFLLDINGPSQVIDTACSSSLVALHRAVQAVRHEGCEMAIAGGSNLMLTPTQHILFSRVGMLSGDGRSKAFARSADGYGRADGVGGLLLKRLDAAERDGDNILGVIRGSAENHGGTASSLTAPNPRAQARLIIEAHRQAGIDPRTVTYIECHGTGTPLGDPVEIEGLKTAFFELARERGLGAPETPYCGLGSVKSNMGHAETAAGVAGVIKVLLEMRAGVLFKSLHADEPNPLIDLNGSPFYLVDRPRAWTRPVVDGKEMPRRAGVSSFGAGGANAHVLIEEYLPEQDEPRSAGCGPQVIVLSARDEAMLKEAARSLATHMESDEAATQSLPDIAYTLQAGRDAMRARLAFVVCDKLALQERLREFLAGGREGLLLGQVERKGVQVAGPQTVLPPASEAELNRLAARWVAGNGVDWAALHPSQGRRRVRLPTCQFQRKRFWLPEANGKALPQGSGNELPQIDKSSNGRQLIAKAVVGNGYSWRLNPEDVFLRDHKVAGAPTLPGVVYLELMRRAAVAAGLPGDLGQVVWLRPLAVAEPAALEISVSAGGEPLPLIEAVRVDAAGERHAHAQARVLPKPEPAAQPQRDFDALERAHPRRYDSTHVYGLFDAMGIQYGATHRTIRSIAVGRDAEGRLSVFGRLQAAHALDPAFVLHPGLMDGAFQCALGMALDADGESAGGAALPFALGRVEIFGPCVPEMAVHIRVSGDGEQTTRVQTLDLELMDFDGAVRVRMQGFVTRKFQPYNSDKVNSDVSETLLFVPEWTPIRAVDESAPFARRTVLLCGWDEGTLQPLAGVLKNSACLGLNAEAGHADGGFTGYARQLLGRIQEIARDPSPVLLQVVVPEDAELLSGLSGMLRCAAHEIPGLNCQLVSADKAASPGDLASSLNAAARSGSGRARSGHEQLLAASWRKHARPAAHAPHPWKDGGVYLITGGLGGLGRLFAYEIASRAAGVTIILASRRPVASEQQAELATLFKRSDARIEFAVLDVSDAGAVQSLVSGVRARYGGLNGVLHAAGLLSDSAIENKTADSLSAVLAPKVTGTCHLDAALGSGPLDLFLLFGSVSGVLGSAGQADYAAGNAFLDAFAVKREARRHAGHCQGRTLSVDWPLWRDGGMRLGPDAERLMTRTTGLNPLESEAAFSALYDALATGEAQVMVLHGDAARIEPRVRDASHSPQVAVSAVPAGGGFDLAQLEQKILASLMQIVSAQLKVAVSDLAADCELTEYGFDSISFTQFANALNDRFGLTITPTLFFEHPSLGALTLHFTSKHAAAFAEALGVARRAAHAVQEIPAPSSPPASSSGTMPTSARMSGGREPVAIVGMTGVFPGAPDTGALWRNLLDGRDAVSGVPAGRWDRQPRGMAARGGFIDSIGEFDAAFFGLSAPEARVIDPQQRLLLTQTWRLLENAGYAPRSLWGAKVGVFAGIADTGYGRLVAQAGGATEGYAMTGLAPSVGPNRVSFYFNLTGPSAAVETACSSALVAVHRAVEAIHSGDCTMAIAGGVNALLSPESFEGFNNAGMLAKDGRSKTFSADADGYGRGEGIGLVLLKPLADAERDGDRILAVVRGSAENHGGRAGSLTAPNPKAQAALLMEAYRRAGFDPRTVTYIEAHGTGTPLGDPIEIEALKVAFSVLSEEAEARLGAGPAMSCGIASVKSNIGHLELAAGAAGLIKVLLQMQHGQLVRSLHCETLNPYLKLDGSAFHVVRETAPWTRRRDANGHELPRRAGVSAFGFGGSNAHVVLEEYIPPAVAPASYRPKEPVVIVLSARSQEQLKECAQCLLDGLSEFSDGDLASVAFTLQTCREAMEFRVAFLASDIGTVQQRLAAFIAGDTSSDVQTGRVKAHREMLTLLDSDEQVRAALAGLPGRGRHDVLLELWVLGFQFDWRTLYGSTPPRRAALPGYPFARTIYWPRLGHAAAPEVPAPSVLTPVQKAPTAASAQDHASAERSVLARLTSIAAGILETEPSQLDPDTELGEFGFDSISMTGFSTKANEELGLSLTPADFFEFATLDRLARHIVESGVSIGAPQLSAEPRETATAQPVLEKMCAGENDDPIAIVGLSCSFPGAADANAFWDNLVRGVSSISEIPTDRWDWRVIYGNPKSEVQKTDIKFGGFMDGVFEFDPLFFGISPREAALMDPQQRLLMTHVWKALEDAGHAPKSLAGRNVGLFVGTAASGYCNVAGEQSGADSYAATGSVASVGPNRMSYFLNWHGPSEPVETACSSSLVALHRAIQAIEAGDCEMAVVGGVNTMVTPDGHINFSKAGMLSPDGACKTFSANANGYVRGEGAGMLVLKRLSEARRDGDSIYAVIRGSAINHGGRANSLTAPNTSAQADLLTQAYARAGIDPATVGYVEAHGTGTALGDPVEVNALKSAFGRLTKRQEGGGYTSPGCGLGSVKTNIGHLELAAGVAGVIKVLMQLRHRTLAPSLNCEPANPYIDFSNSPFFIVKEAQPWQCVKDERGRELLRRAGVSSFGFGGVNAHVILEEYVEADGRRAYEPYGGPVVVPLSACDARQLDDQVWQLRVHLDKGAVAEGEIADLAFTLQMGRTALKHRVAFVVDSIDALKSALNRFLSDDLRDGAKSGTSPRELPADAGPEAVAAFWAQGGDVDWKRLYSRPHRRLHLPTYPFARDVYRAGYTPAAESAAISNSPAGVVSLDPDTQVLREHVVAGTPVLPGVMTLELARAASGRQAPLSLGQIVWMKPLLASAGTSARIEFGDDGLSFRLMKRDRNGEVAHAQGKVLAAPDPVPPLDIEAISKRCRVTRSAAWLYDAFASAGLDYGPAFRAVADIRSNSEEVLARLVLPEAAEQAAQDYVMHPSLLDGALQACLAIEDGAHEGGTTMVPFALDRLDMLAPTACEMWAHIRPRRASGSVRKIDIELADSDGNVCVRFAGFTVRTLAKEKSGHSSGEALRDSGARYLTKLVAAETGVPAAQIELTASLDAYGIDSMMIVRLTDEMEKVFGPLPTTLFFEHRTLGELRDFLVRQHGERLSAFAGGSTQAARSPDDASRDPAPALSEPVKSELNSPIAIVGLAGRYPGARTLLEFWENLAEGRDCITEVPPERWDASRMQGLAAGAGAIRGGFIDGAAEFDPLFFNISPRDAPYMDPQERIFLQCAYEAIEDAGHTPATLAKGGDVGVFAGVMWEEYQLYGAESTAKGEPLALSSSPASIANRVSAVCDFHGPSMAVDSMCSSSLTAIHLACESLWLGTCDAAIAGGVNLSLHPNKYLALAQGRFLASSGRCESFGAGGDGYVPGEGAGAVVLKRLDRAQADGDHIYGVIRGSSLNHGGKTNGYTVPNPQAQAGVIRRALDRAGVTAREVSYVEAHGTGTKLGDPIEIAALSAAYRADTPESGYCAIGSVKSNIGHCESAAGIAALTKVLLQMKHERLAPSLHAEVLNPGIDFDASPFVVQRHLAEWRRPALQSGAGRRIAGISSFGAGGSNAHLIVEEAPQRSTVTSRGEPYVFPFSARDKAALNAVAARFLTELETAESLDLASAAFVLQTGRQAFEERLAVVAGSREELRGHLRAALAGESPHVYRGTRRPNAGEVASAIIDSHDLLAMARAWTGGAVVDWTRLWLGRTTQRMSLPTYPFARDVYWVPGRTFGQPIRSGFSPQPASTAAASLPLLFAPKWQPAAAARQRDAAARRIALFCGVPAPRLASVECVEVARNGDTPQHHFARGAERLLTLIQSLIKERPASALLQVVVPVGVLEGLAGMLRTAMHEHPVLRCQLIAVEPAHQGSIGAVLEAEVHSSGIDIRYEGGQRHVRTWREFCPITGASPFKDNGVYLITGGTGGIGLHLARHIAASVEKPTLVLTSRSKPSDAITARLSQLGATVVHHQIDVSNEAAMESLIAGLMKRAGRIDGIVHAAGITRDKLIVRKTAAELSDVLAPKVSGLAALDQASADCDLDFFLLFASASGALGNAGQADYAVANAFMDAFAEQRNERVARGERRGLTLAIDWPYWRDGGMTLPEGTIDAMTRTGGVKPLETKAALAALDAAVVLAREERLSQVLVLDGDQERLRGMLNAVTAAQTREPRTAPVQAAKVSKNSQPMLDWVRAELAKVLNVPADKLDPDETFDRYGLDSVAALQAVENLEAKLGKLPNTLLFEFPTLNKLAAELADSHNSGREGSTLYQAPQEKADEAVVVASRAPSRTAEDGIAIVAVAGRYPGAGSSEELWEALKEGRDLVTEVPPGRWDMEAIFAPGKGVPGKSCCRWGGFISDVDAFDAAFFGISPREATRMDPQERLILETTWHLLERGGYTRQRLKHESGSKVGVFIGSMSQQYRALDADPSDRPVMMLSTQASLANRVSHVFDLNGPSVAVDSMCSSGLEAVHLACQALQRGDCRMAIAGAVNLSIHPDKYVALSEAGLTGSRHTSRPFTGGDGYLPAEGAGAVLLRPLADALASQDLILGVIKGTAVNHSGRSTGYGVPNAEAQQQLIEDCLKKARIDARSIGYVEAAATGTALGDAIELRALARAFRTFTHQTGFCALGSIKANMGHAEAASGLAQLTKCLLQLQHRTLLPMCSVAEVDPEISFDGTPFVLQKQLAPWTRMHPDQPLRAAINSFGAGGTNVHLILEEAPALERTSVKSVPGPWRFVFSAQNEERLSALIGRMTDYVEAYGGVSLARLAWTLSACRERLPVVAEFVAADRHELLEKLAAWPSVPSGLAAAGGVSAFENVGFGPPLILPAYPFARTRYWIGLQAGSAPSADTGPTSAGVKSPRDIILAALAHEIGLNSGEVPCEAAFRDLGAASIFSMRLVRTLADELSVEITHRDIETHDSVNALTAFVEQRVDKPGLALAPGVASSPAAETGLSQGQLGLWALQNLFPDMSTYNVPLAFRIARLKPAALDGACAALLARYPILTRPIREDDGTPRTRDPMPLAVEQVLMPAGADEIAFLKTRAARPFDLAAAPPIRFELIRRAGQSEGGLVLIAVHHIVADGMSAAIMAQEFWSAYVRLSDGRNLPPPQPETDYEAFVTFERLHLVSPRGEAQLEYWKKQLSGLPPVLDLPSDRPGNPSGGIVPASAERHLAPDLVRRAGAAARAMHVNLPAFMLGVLNIILHRYTGQGDIVVGVPVMGRPEKRFEQTVGFFANMVLVRTVVSGHRPAADIIGDVQTRMIEALDNSDISYASLVRALGRTPAEGPLHQVSFAYQNFLGAGALPDDVEPVAAVRQLGSDPLGLEFYEEGGALRLVANYDASRFDCLRIERLLDHYTRLVAAVSAAPGTPVSECNLLNGDERARILGAWATGGPAPETHGNVVEWITEQAARTPDAIAAVSGGDTLTYSQLIHRAHELAVRLAAHGVRSGDRAGVLLGRGTQSVVALLGVMRAGAVYVPFDLAQPGKRLVATLKDAGLRIAVVDEAAGKRLTGLGIATLEMVRIDSDAPAAAEGAAHVMGPIDPSRAAYVIFTSGSTGRPKGVAVSHEALAHHCVAAIKCYGLNADDRVLQFSALSVDPSLEQILPALISGATLVMRGEMLWTPAELREVFERDRVSVADLPPAYLGEVLAAWNATGERPDQVPRLLICGGEVLTPDIVRLWRTGPLSAARLINAYGPTEATITALTHEVEPRDIEYVPVGRPLPGTNVFVLDTYGHPVPEGVAGELYIGGARAAIGYLGDETLTHERFVSSPFGSGRLYRTGDRVAFIPGTDGMLAFLGRVDAQVKIRGFRVELAEVELALSSCGVGNAAVLFHSGRLIACVAAGEEQFNAEDIAAAMAARLPVHMCPATYFRLERLPLTPSGKVDRAQLLSIALAQDAEPVGICSAAEPMDGVEKRLAALWHEALQSDPQTLPLGRTSDFFASGGHSLVAVRLISAIERTFGRRLTMAELIAAPTLAGQAGLLQAVARGETPRSRAAEVIPLRQGGTRLPLWLLHPVGGGVTCYLPLALRLDPEIPIFGIAAPEIELAAGSATETLPERAAAYVKALRTVQSKGPYRLGGWSFGGLLAFEMAAQLHAAGEKIAPVVLIDTYAPSLLRELGMREGGNDHDMLAQFALDLSRGEASLPLRCSNAAEPVSAGDLLGVPELTAVLSGVDERQLEIRFAIFRANMAMAEAYNPKPCAVPVQLYVASDGHCDRTRGWRELTLAGLDVVDLPGNHFSIPAEPAVGLLALEMSKELQRRDRRHFAEAS